MQAHKLLPKRFRISVALALTFVVALLPGTSPVLAAQQNEIILGVEFDGLQPNGDAPFAGNTDGQHTPGDDENQNNNVVLSNDLIGYRIDWNVNEVDGTVVAVTATLPEGMNWVTDPGTAFGAPVGCVDDGSSTISANSGRDLYCVLDAEHEGSNGVIRPQANAGSQFDATSLQLQAFIESDQLGAVGSNTVETFASARPKADWVKGADVLAGDPPAIVAQEPSEEIHGVTDPDTGEVGRIWLYPLRLQPVGGLVGAEKMDDSQDILIFDHAYQMPPNAKLATGLVPNSPSGVARTACGAYDGVGGFPVASPGTWTCALDAAATAANGYPVVQIDISGHDTSTLPPLNGDGSTNASTIMAGQIAFFVPESDFPSGAFSMDINNGISGTIDPVTVPADLDPIQVWGSAPASFDEAGVVNNFAYWNASAVPTSGSPGRSFRHSVQYNEGPYQELSKQTPDGRDYRSVDNRVPSVGGLGWGPTNTVNPAGTTFGWGHGINGPMSQLTPRGNELVITAELDHFQTAPRNPYFYEASSLCVGIDPTHQSIMALPSSFDVNHIVDDSHPFIWGSAAHDDTTQGSSNSGSLAQVHIGAHPNYATHIYSFTHAVETTLVDIPHVVEFAAATNPADQNVDMHEVTCNNADADGRGWVDAEGDLSVFDSVTPGDGVYEDITNVRLRVTGPMQWYGSPLRPVQSSAGTEAWGTSMNLNVQVKVKADPTVNEADQELFAYASRAYTPSPLPHTPEEVVVWDPETMANPGTPACTNATAGLWNDRYGDGVNHNTTVPNGWCNLPFEDDGSSSTDLADNPHDFGGGGENAYELSNASTIGYTSTYPALVHADKITIVEAELGINKANLAGPNDVNTNGDTIEFEVNPSIVGSSLDTISDVILTDTLPAQYEFIGFTQNPTTATNTSAVSGNTIDGTDLAAPVCSVSGQTITCNFGTQVGGWSDTIRYEVRVRDTGPNATYTNTARIAGNDALSGEAKTPKTATARSFTPNVFDESGIIKMVDRHIGPCATYPADAGTEPADWADDCSIIAADGNIRYTLDIANEGYSNLENYRVIDILPHMGDDVEIQSNTLTGDGRTPESDFSGTIELIAASAPGTTFLYSMDDPNTISRDPDHSTDPAGADNTWCDAPAGGAAVFGSGACPGSLADVTAVYADMGTLDFPDTRTLTIDLKTAGNECGDIYTNNFGARTDDILLPIRSNDVSAMVGFCEPSVDIEKDTNGVQADNIDEDVDGDGNLDVDEDTNNNGVLDTGEDVDSDGNLDVDEDTNDANGVLDAAAPAGSNVGPGVPEGGDVTWTYVVTNGDVALVNAVVADSDPAVTVDCDIDGDGTFDGTDTIPVLLPNAEITCQATGTAVLGQYSNNSTVTGTPVVPTAVDPSIDPDDPATWPDDPNFDPADESTWPLDPAIDLSDPTTWPTDPAGYGAPVDPVTGEPMFPAELTDEDPSHYWGIPADVGVGIEKDTNGVQADDNAGPAIPVGDTVTWTYVVTNTGQLPITPATVADSDPALSVVCEPSLADTGGDDVIDIFLPGESVTCTATGEATAGNYTNTATVSGPTSLPTEPCVCDPTDPTTWPTTGDSYTENVDENGDPITVEDTDNSAYNGAEPAIDIEKDTNGNQSDETPGEFIPTGDPVTWTYEVTNTGTTALADATVTDDQGVTVDCDVDGDGVLDGTNIIAFLLPGASVTCEGTGTATSGPYTNNATVSGNPIMPDFATCDCDPEDPDSWPTNPEDYQPLLNADGTPADPVTDEDPSNYWGFIDDVGVDIEKDTNGVQADDNAGPAIPVGDTVTWTYVVTNTGQAPITPATVADSDPALTVVCEASLADTGGDDVIDIFLPGESVTCTATGEATGGNYTNTATVSGPTSLPTEPCVCDPTDPTTWPTTGDSYTENVDENGDPITVEDTDNSHYNGAAPAIDIEKDTNGNQSDETPGEFIPTGDPVTWTYVVTNTGTTALADATVTDDQGVTVDCDVDGDGVLDGTNIIAFLLPGASVTCEGTGTAVEGQYTNNATVSGDPIMPDFATCDCDPEDPDSWPTDPAEYTPLLNADGTTVDPVTDEDPSNYWGVATGAGVNIEKDTNGVQADDNAGPAIPVGDTVTWTYVVTNTGQLPITPATVADSDPALTVVCEASLADTGGDDIIDMFLPGESVTCTATGIAAAGNYTNTATVSGPTSLPTEPCVCDPTDPATWPTSADSYVENVDENGDPITVEDTDNSAYNGAEPGIDIEKDTNGAQSDETPGEFIPTGDPVTWTYQVANTGTTALADATVTDDQGVTVDCDVNGDGTLDGTNIIAFLLPGASVTCEGTGTATGGPYTNNASVSGNPIMPDFETCDCDPQDPTTWPTNPENYTALLNADGTPADPVTDEDPSNYTGTQKISGTVWDDDNGDGEFDDNETTHEGVLVELLDADGNPVLDPDGNPITALTDTDGNYSFDVPPGNYQLRFTPPDGVDMTTPNTINVNVEPGIDVPNLNAGLDTTTPTPTPESNNPTPTKTAPGKLALTGGNIAWITLTATTLLAAGIGLTLIGRRKRRTT